MAATSYSPRLRTALVLCGAGTAGAYHAGVLRALTEAGVKIDLVAAHGPGSVAALAAAIDGAGRLSESPGLWNSPRIAHAYRWRPALRAAGIALLVAMGLLLSPLLVLVISTLAYAASLLAALVSLPDVAAMLVRAYGTAIAFLFAPPVLPTVIPRAVVLALLVVVVVVTVSAVREAYAGRAWRRTRGAWWWMLLGAPLDGEEPGALFVETVWALVRGASTTPRPSESDLGRRYADILTDNFGQPGFREVLLAVHDLDARRDLVAALLPFERRAAFQTRRDGAGPREAETLDLAGLHRELLVDVLLGAQRLPGASAPHVMQWPSESYWRGESHRLCDRPELTQRLIDEIAGLGLEQVILTGPAPPPAAPHGMRARPRDFRGRIGDVLRSVETAALDDGLRAAAARFSGVFVIRPDHNPIGPFDYSGAYDEGSDRKRRLPELIRQGYADAYRQFIEPVVASGERVEVI